MIGLLDIGGTKLLAAVTDNDGTIGAAVRQRTGYEDPVAQLGSMLDLVRDGAPLTAIGIAVPGPFDRERAAFLEPPNLGGPWRHLSLRDTLGQRFGCRVAMENDANCAALAEWRFGAGRGMRSIVYYTVSTGIGCGVISDGRLLLGRRDTEGGHQVLWPASLGGPACPCGGSGCLEVLASGSGLLRRHGRHAEELDDQAVWDDVGRWLGLAVANTTALHDPEAIIFGGGVCARWEQFAPALRRTAVEHVHLQPLPALLRGTCGDTRNLLGALALVEGN